MWRCGQGARQPQPRRVRGLTGANGSATATLDKPLCSTLGHPNAGKLADKDTGAAKDHSASPVHQDCIPDTAASASGSGSSR